MGRGRAPCCDKNQVKKGPWTPAEDLRLITFIQRHGHANWRSLPKQAGLLRCGKSCRLRWINYLRPDVKRGNFTQEEEETVIKLHQSLGNKWSKIASHLPGRTDNEIKNVWNTHLKKRSIKKAANAANVDHKDETEKFSRSSSFSSSSSLSSPHIGEEHKDQEDQCQDMELLKNKQDILTVLPSSATDELKEASSSSSISSNCSTSSRVDDSMATEEIDFNLDQVIIDTPSESDIDQFWEMLNNLDPLEFNESQFEASQDSKFGDQEYDQGGTDCTEWLKYLENELGLVDPDHQHQQSTMDGGCHKDHNQATSDDAKEDDYAAGQLGSEIDQGQCCFQLWASPPHNFGI